MKKINNLVHYIWVGNKKVPEKFMDNFNRTKQMNPDYEFKIWTDLDFDSNEFYSESSLFHKLQLARYTTMDKFGGLYSDFDIHWKLNFDEVYSLFDDADMIFPKRNSLHFYNRGMKTDLIDDFVIISKPNLTNEFLKYCEVRTERRDSITEPYSVYALTEWLLGKNNIKFLTHNQIDTDESCTVAIHDNKKTWQETTIYG